MDLPHWTGVWVKDNEMPEVQTKIIPREEWGAKPPKGDIDPLPTPVKYVGYSCNREITWNKCSNRQDCSKVMRMMQKKHMEEGFPDIKYNFLIGDDGLVYEGRGWDKRPQIYYERPLRKSFDSLIEIAYIGVGEANYINVTMLDIYEAWVKIGRKENKIREDYQEKNFCDTMEMFVKGEKDKFESDEEEEEEEEQQKE